MNRVPDELLTELRNQSVRQYERRYKWLDIDSRVLIRIIDELQNKRTIGLEFERPTEPALRD